MMIKTLEEHAGLTAALAEQLGAKRYETHISTVLVADGKAWKIKKPLDLGFLDFSTLERREYCCSEEVRLNSRLADDVYIRVVPISGTVDQPALDDSSAVMEYAVEMREFPADALLADHQELLDESAMDTLARQVAQFQRDITCAPADGEFGTPEAVLFPMQQNFDQLRELVSDTQDLERLDQLNRWTVERFETLEETLQTRLADGFIGEGHGDMHLGNIAVEEGRFIIFDGIEFNPNLRWIDHVNEIAFFMMDLDRNGRNDLSGRFLNSWLIASGDYAGLALMRFYQVYRAMVRTKIAAFRLAQELTEAERDEVTRAYREYLSLAETYVAEHTPLLAITFGPSGSGKSVVARKLVATMPAVQIASDVERKRLAGLDPLESSDSKVNGGIYTSGMSLKTYQRLGELSETVINAGFTAIADATFLKAADRQHFSELAGRLGVPFRILQLQTDEDELARRVEARLARGDDPAEADSKVLAMQLASREPLNSDELQHVVTLTPEMVNAAELVSLL